MEKKIGFRSIRDLSPSLLQDFFISTSQHNSYGDGMYFAYSYDFAKIFSQNIATKKFAVIGEYDVIFDSEKLTIKIDEKGNEIKDNNQIQRLYDEMKSPANRRHPSIIKNDLELLLNSYDIIDFEGREFVLKKETSIILKRFSILFRDEYAKELFDKIKLGDLVSDTELKNISAEMTEIVSIFFKEKELI